MVLQWGHPETALSNLFAPHSLLFPKKPPLYERLTIVFHRPNPKPGQSKDKAVTFSYLSQTFQPDLLKNRDKSSKVNAC